MEKNPEIRKLLARITITELPEDYTVVSIDRKEEEKSRQLFSHFTPFFSITFESHEVSVVAKTQEWVKTQKYFSAFIEESPFRVITFDTVLDLNIIGFMAVIASNLALIAVPIYPVSTFLRDHIVVKKKDTQKAVDSLRHMFKECADEYNY